MATQVRELDRERDRAAVESIDTAFDTDVVFDVVTRERGIELVERGLERPITKRYGIGEVFAPWASWDVGWVAEDGAVRGFATVEHEAADTLYYGNYMPGETALYLAKRL